MKLSELEQVIYCIEHNKSVKHDKLIQWMASDNLDVLGVVVIIFDKSQSLIDYMPNIGQVTDFYIKYYSRCILENPDSEFCDNRYMACYSLCNYYKVLRSNKDMPNYILETIRNMIENVYKKGDSELRMAIINGCLEHLFESKDIVDDFSKWKKDAELRKAYDMALDWNAPRLKK